ncbi:MAG: low temperature requirement protein A [Chloroflexi bacterium]|nr:low temperature requirement protein A [Chloroflexota bacterium]
MQHTARTPHLNTDIHRKVSWLELFYDLVYVATIVQLGNKLSEDVSDTGFLGFVLLFVPIWWVWMGTTFYANRFAADDVVHHLLIFAQIFVVSALAIHVFDGLGETSAGFALAYAAARGILVIMYLRASRYVPEARALARRYALGFAIAALIWLVSAFVPPPYRFGLWIVGLLVDFWVPLSPASVRLQRQLPPSPHHLPERMGLFTTIVFGESFIKVIGGFSGHEIEFQRVIVALMGLVLVGSLWWVYFENVAERAVNWARGAQVWIYTHLPLQLALVALAVGIYKLVTLHGGHGEEVLPTEYRLLICISVALALVSTSVIELCMIKGAEERAGRPEFIVHNIGALAALGVGIFGGALDVMVVMFILMVICFAQVLFDLYRRAGLEPAADVSTIEV